jgi:hypothetical protein
MNENMNKGPQMGLDFDIANTTPINGFNDGIIFAQGTILRKVSKFLAGTEEDSILPIPVFYDIESKKILKDSIPPALRKEYEDHTL